MPYIKQQDKTRFADIVRTFGSSDIDFPATAGELNYLLTELCIAYIQVNGLNYQKLNDVIGALEGCKLEFYRRTVAPYEETKIHQNGDVY